MCDKLQQTKGETVLLYQPQAQLIFQALLGLKDLSHTEGQRRGKKKKNWSITRCKIYYFLKDTM